MPDLLSPPFITIEGLANFRDCGGYPSTRWPGKSVRKGIIYRSADPSRISDQGIARLQQLHITKVFDLRSQMEIEKSTISGWGQIKEWEHASRVPVPVFPDEFYINNSRVNRDSNLKQEGHQGYLNYYRDILASALSPENTNRPFYKILSYLANTTANKLEPILIHCSLGKDRTGVICALILGLCGVDQGVISQEYALTALGIKDKVAEIIAEMRPNGPGLTTEEERFFGSKKESMRNFLEWIESHGGVEAYLIEKGLLSPREVRQLQENLLGEF